MLLGASLTRGGGGVLGSLWIQGVFMKGGARENRPPRGSRKACLFLKKNGSKKFTRERGVADMVVIL
jgi:hypothetical protein